MSDIMFQPTRGIRKIVFSSPLATIRPGQRPRYFFVLRYSAAQNREFRRIEKNVCCINSEWMFRYSWTINCGSFPFKR